MEQAPEFAAEDGSADGLVGIVCGVVVDRDQFIVFLAAEVAELDEQESGLLNGFGSGGALKAADGFRANEVGQRSREVERFFAGGSENVGEFLRGEARRRGQKN